MPRRMVNNTPVSEKPLASFRKEEELNYIFYSEFGGRSFVRKFCTHPQDYVITCQKTVVLAVTASVTSNSA